MRPEWFTFVLNMVLIAETCFGTYRLITDASRVRKVLWAGAIVVTVIGFFLP